MKTDITQERIRKVLMGVLLPLARTLLRCGVSYTEFASISKRAFVEAASADYGVRNRPTNIARVAVMTGLSRKEVSRIRRESRKAVTKLVPAVTIPAAVLNEWHKNPRFTDRSGSPRLLAYSGRGDTFTSLVTGVTSDIPPGAMRRELMRAGAIRAVERTKLFPVKRHFVPDAVDEKLIVGLELGVRRLAETISFNTDPEKLGANRFQRFVEGPLSNAQEIKRIRALIHQRLSSFAMEIDDLMPGGHASSKKEKTSARGGDVLVRPGVGIYYYEGSD